MNALPEPIRGSCLCRAVTFTIAPPVLSMGHCHCGLCRRAHGTAFSTYCQVAAASLTLLSGAEAVQDFVSSATAVRQFCRQCGSKLFYRLRAPADTVWVAAGALDDDPGARPGYHLFVADKAGWYDIPDALPRYAGFPPGDGH
jgi:hypothetical protein